jgi:hypothetical protein
MILQNDKNIRKLKLLQKLNKDLLIEHKYNNNNNNNNNILTAIGLSPGGSGYFTCTQIWKEKSN